VFGVVWFDFPLAFPPSSVDAALPALPTSDTKVCVCCCIPSHRMSPTWCPRSCSSECVSVSCSLIGVCACVVASHPTGWPPRGVHALVPQTVSLFLALLLAFVCVCVCVVASHPTGWPPTWCPPLQFLKCASVSRSLLMDVCVFVLLSPTFQDCPARGIHPHVPGRPPQV
jgi:hypothetical protein